MADYYFRLPSITDLTIPQQAVLDESAPVAVSGGPGTGKSIVSVWRHARNHTQGKRSLLLTYTHSLKHFLKHCCVITGIPEAVANIHTSYQGKPYAEAFDEIIIDEAQDLEAGFHSELKSMGRPVSFSADDSQILYRDHCTTYRELCEIFPDNAEYVLDRNFRSTQHIMLFARKAFPGIITDQRIIDGLAGNPGPLPIALPYSYENIFRLVHEYASPTHNVGIIIQWIDDVKSIFSALYSNGIDCSVYVGDDGGGDVNLKNVHITTCRSAKGLEFDTVILPDFPYFYGLTGNPDYCNAISEEDLYVAVTRARSNLFILGKNFTPSFRDTFSGLIQFL